MPLNAGDTGYGSVSGPPGLSGGAGCSETAPLLVPEHEPEPGDRWQPLTKQELEVAAGGPGWRRLRCYLVLLFWLAWLAMLATSIAIIALSPRPVAPPLRWWQRSLFYQLQPELLMEAQGRGPGEVDGEDTKMSSLDLIWPQIHRIVLAVANMEFNFSLNGNHSWE
uniref:Solute carrier family 3 member 2 N-terminal domain-containing protein n=1 Tax=Echeneis naucrates TaxID=173247 RepID=A0A665UJX3_ECHNA